MTTESAYPKRLPPVAEWRFSPVAFWRVVSKKSVVVTIPQRKPEDPEPEPVFPTVGYPYMDKDGTERIQWYKYSPEAGAYEKVSPS